MNWMNERYVELRCKDINQWNEDDWADYEYINREWMKLQIADAQYAY